jgi:hypothetical protein
VGQRPILTPKERTRITEIQDLLIDRFVEHREAIERGQIWRVQELDAQIEELQQEKKDVMQWAAGSSN